MAPLIVRTISRYLLRQHVAPLGFALAALTSLMLIQQVAKQLSGLLGKGLPAGVIAEVFLLSLPFIVAVTLPMAVLVAVLHVFARRGGENEMTARQAGGVSVARVVGPVLAGATGVALLSFLWNDQLLPRTNHALRTLQVDIARKKPSLTLKEQVINEVVPGQTFLRASRIDGNTNKLKDVTLYDLSDAERRRIITADSARMVIENDLRRLAGLAPVAATPLRDAPDTTPPGVYCRALRRIAAWLLPPEVEAQTPQGTLPRPTTSPTPAGRPVPQLWVTPGAGVGEAQRLRDAHIRAATYEVEIQKKYASAAASLVFAPLGVPVAIPVP